MVGTGGYLLDYGAETDLRGAPDSAITPLPRDRRGPGRTGMAIVAARRRLLAVGERTLSPETAALLHGMLLGVREGLPETTAGNFRRAGVAHLLSVSGLHLMFWLGLFWGLGRLLGLSERWLAMLSLPVVLFFLLLAGAGAPALRAGVMSLAGILGAGGTAGTKGKSSGFSRLCHPALASFGPFLPGVLAFLYRLRRTAFSLTRLGRGFCGSNRTRAREGEI